MLWVAVLILSGGASGCAPWLNPTLRAIEQQRLASLPTAAPQQAVELEVFFIERPVDDPLTGNALWNQLDQIGSVDATSRERLQANGLRFGIAGRTFPSALQTLTDRVFDDGPGHRTTRQQYQTPSGVTHQFPCGDLPDPAVIGLMTDEGREELQFSRARGVFRCRVETTQEGWARLEVLPEIHHGELKMRHTATDKDWDWSGRQAVHPLYPQRFSVILNEGETLILGPVGDRPDSIGSRMFRGNEAAEPMSRLLAIRLKSLGQVQPVLQAPR